MKKKSICTSLFEIFIYAVVLILFWLSNDVTTISCNSQGECINDMDEFLLDKPRKFYLQNDLDYKTEADISSSKTTKSKKFYIPQNTNYYASCKSHIGIFRYHAHHDLNITSANGDFYNINSYKSKKLCLNNADILNSKLLNKKLPQKVELPNERRVFIILGLLILVLIIIEMEAGGLMPEYWYKLNLKWSLFIRKHFK